MVFIDELYSKPDKPVLVAYAKGTTELGSVGVSGVIFSRVVKKAFPKQVAFRGAHYNAITSGLSFLKGGSDTAAREMVNAVTMAIRSPSKKIFLCRMCDFL